MVVVMIRSGVVVHEMVHPHVITNLKSVSVKTSIAKFLLVSAVAEVDLLHAVQSLNDGAREALTQHPPWCWYKVFSQTPLFFG